MSHSPLTIPLLGKDEVRFDPSAGEVVAGDIRIALTPCEAVLLGTLDRANGACVPVKDLAWSLYSDRDTGGENMIRLLVMTLRRKLAGTGIGIETRVGFGYRLRSEDSGEPVSTDSE